MKCNCGSRFNKASYAPRVLGCGHTLCNFCISTIMNNGEIVCVFCDYKHVANGVMGIPLNFSILDTLQEDDTSSKENVCAIHKASFKGFCVKCKVFICKCCSKDLHNADFGCVEASMEEGFETLSTGHKVDHLSSLIQIYSENLIIGKTKVEEAKQAEMAFRECLWSATNDRQHLELYYEDLEKKMDALVVFKESLSKCRSLNDFNDGNKKLSTLKKVVLTMEKDATPELQPSCANLLNNLPIVIGAFQAPMTRNSNVFVVNAEKEVCFPLVKDNGIRLLSPRPIADLPPGAFSFKMTPQFEKIVFENRMEVSIIWGNNLTSSASNSGSLGLSMGGCDSSSKDTLKADIDIIGNIPEDIHKNFMQVCVYRKLNDYYCYNDINFIYICRLHYECDITVLLFNHQRPSELGDEVGISLYCDKSRLDSYFLATNNQDVDLKTIRENSQKLDASRGCPVLVLKEAYYLHFIFMKFPIVNVSKLFEVVGYCKGGVVGDFVGNPTDWSAEFRLL